MYISATLAGLYRPPPSRTGHWAAEYYVAEVEGRPCWGGLATRAGNLAVYGLR
jgi:hypothetical protein